MNEKNSTNDTFNQNSAVINNSDDQTNPYENIKEQSKSAEKINDNNLNENIKDDISEDQNNPAETQNDNLKGNDKGKKSMNKHSCNE